MLNSCQDWALLFFVCFLNIFLWSCLWAKHKKARVLYPKITGRQITSRSIRSSGLSSSCGTVWHRTWRVSSWRAVPQMCAQLAVLCIDTFWRTSEFAFQSTSAVRKTFYIWMFKPEVSHFLFSPYWKGFWSLKYSPLPPGCYRFVGLVVKASASRAGGPRFESR